MDGWISLHRKYLEHWLYLEPRVYSRSEAWVDLLLTANHKNNKFLLGKEMIEVKRGSFITSELKLAEKWSWSRTKVRAFLELLEKEQMIAKKPDSKKTTLTIVNYGNYQISETAKKPQKNNGETAEKQPKNTNNNDNKKDIKPLLSELRSDSEMPAALPKPKKTRAKPHYEHDSPHYKAAKWLADDIRRQNPDYREIKESSLQSWANEARRMIEIDKLDRELMSRVLVFARQDSFWRQQILSMGKFREQFDTLLVRYQAYEGKRNDGGERRFPRLGEIEG